jgi:hypothetical protein
VRSWRSGSCEVRRSTGWVVLAVHLGLKHSEIVTEAPRGRPPHGQIVPDQPEAWPAWVELRAL